MAARSTNVTLQNNTTLTLTRTNANLSHGIWSQNLYPPQTIDSNSKGNWQSESDGFMTGTEGTVTYQFLNAAGSVTINWDNPYAGSNSYSHSVPKGYILEQTGGSGNNAVVTFTLSVDQSYVSDLKF